MEGARRIQHRVVRSASGRVGWAPVSGLRRSVGRSQVLLDVPGFRIPGATRDCRRRRSPGRTRSHRLARWAETQLTSGVEWTRIVDLTKPCGRTKAGPFDV